jgi:type VI secretion system secreted protein Hcp
LSKLEPAHCIQLVSVQQGMKQQVTTDVSNAARTSGRPVVTEVSCVKQVDRLSPRLYDYCLRARPLGAGAARPTFLYILRGAGKPDGRLVTYVLRDALVSEIGFQTHPDGEPTESFKLNFNEILWSVASLGGPNTGVVSAGWSLAQNRPIAQFT